VHELPSVTADESRVQKMMQVFDTLPGQPKVKVVLWSSCTDPKRDQPLKLTVYPQAFTKRYSHMQAHGVPYNFCLLIRSLNRELAVKADDANPVIQVIAFQGYNVPQMLTNLCASSSLRKRSKANCPRPARSSRTTSKGSGSW
jgi:hypothetical protein